MIALKLDLPKSHESSITSTEKDRDEISTSIFMDRLLIY